jgi:perosamine synthetase
MREIPSGGPWITNREIEYVRDACENGWYKNWNGYLTRFERKMAEISSSRFALATSSCTGALHIAMLALGLREGDEVILPEVTWTATATCVCYVRATPVFVDVERDTWCMDPEAFRASITRNTKAVIPVHMYGHPANMAEINRIASAHGIHVIEDAAPGIGSRLDGRPMGSFGLAAAFSFQGAKPLVTGEGGALVTSDENFYDRAYYYADHCRDKDRILYTTGIGVKYKMANIQAALGLAQLERIEEITAKRRTIFFWYKERLGDVEGLRLNAERPGCWNNYYVPTMILEKDWGISRDEVMERMNGEGVRNRPFFRPISKLPMFSPASTPVADALAARGINLPCATKLTEEDVDYASQVVRRVLGERRLKVRRTDASGVVSHRSDVHGILKAMKSAPDRKLAECCLGLEARDGKKAGRLRPVTTDSLRKGEEVRLLAEWRDAAQEWFPSQFKVTVEGTRNWLDRQVLQQEDRILFMVETKAGVPVGHVGLVRFNCEERFCELDNIVRGNARLFKGAMTLACAALTEWAFETLGMKKLYLRVFADNERAIALYQRLGFREIQRVPLMRLEEGEVVKWEQVIGEPYHEAERYFVTMKLSESDWRARRV